MHNHAPENGEKKREVVVSGRSWVVSLRRRLLTTLHHHGNPLLQTWQVYFRPGPTFALLILISMSVFINPLHVDQGSRSSSDARARARFLLRHVSSARNRRDHVASPGSVEMSDQPHNCWCGQGQDKDKSRRTYLDGDVLG